MPDSVKFDADGFIVSTQVASGQVLRIDPRTGEQTVLAQLTPGLDNCTFVDGRLFVSNFTGEITEILGGGETRTVLPGATELAAGPRGRRRRPASTSPTAPTSTRWRPTARCRPSACCSRPAIRASCAGWCPPGPASSSSPRPAARSAATGRRANETDYLADGFDQLYGVAIAPGGGSWSSNWAPGGCCRSTARAASRCWRPDSHDPVGVTVDADGDVLVAESGAGRVVRVTRSGHRDRRRRTADARRASWRIGGQLFIVDAGAKAVIAFDLATGARTHDRRPGCRSGRRRAWYPSRCKGMPPFSGPQGPFAGIAAGPDGTLYVSADGERQRARAAAEP